MFYKTFFTLFLFFTIFLNSSCTKKSDNDSTLNTNSKIQLLDFENNTVTLNSPAKRIVALAPHIVENLFTVGLGSNIVGVVSHSDFPQAAKSLPIIGHYNGISAEKILSTDPDLVIAWSSGTSAQLIEKLKDLEIPVYLDNPKTLPAIAKSLGDLSTLGGLNPKNVDNINSYLKKIHTLTEQHHNHSPLSVFIAIGEKPLRTLNGKHIVSDMLNNCGGTNIFSELTAIAPTINYESLLERAPQVILVGAKTQQQAEDRLKNMKIDFLDSRNQTKKDQNEHNKFSPYTIFIDPDILYRHTVRMADAMKILCTRLDDIRERIGTRDTKKL